jgi:dienelactone hydrolase
VVEQRGNALDDRGVVFFLTREGAVIGDRKADRMISPRLLFAVAFFALSSLAFAASGAQPVTYAVDQQRESFMSGGRRISVETFVPRGPGRFPAVLVLHSSAGTLFGKKELERFSRAVAERGMVAFMVRYFDRTGTIFANDQKIEKDLHVWEDTVADAMNFVAAHSRVRRDSIGMFGYSLGAFLAVSVASREARVDAVAELSGGMFDYLGGRLRRVPPLLILHGTADERVNIRYARALEREARRLGTRPVVQYFPGEGHVLSKPAIAQASARAVDFLGTHLLPPRIGRVRR